MNQTIKILHLYYDLMNLYGEYGNVKILESHLLDQGFIVIVDKKTIGDNINFNQYDLIYMGSGTEKNQLIALNDIKKHFKSDLIRYIESGKLLLLTGNSYEIFGTRIGKIEAVGAIDIETDILDKRNTSDIISVSRLINSKIVGFVNNASSITNKCEHLLNIEFGIGENKIINKEGVVYKGLIGTHLIGPLLVRNPELLKYVVKKIGECVNPNFLYNDIKYEEEEKAYQIALSELSGRKK